MRPRIEIRGRLTHVLEEKSIPLASTQVHERRCAARAQSLAIHHKVGCSWSARAGVDLDEGSAGPTTPPRFEPSSRSTPARQTGEPTVSHEGCSGLDFSSAFSISEQVRSLLASTQVHERRCAARAQSLAIHHKVGCSWSASPDIDRAKGSAGPTTPPRFEPFARSISGLQTGEPTVSHEGCSGRRACSTFSRVTYD